MRNQRKGIGPVVASALLIVVAVVAIIGFQTWFSGYSSKIFADSESRSQNSVSGTGVESVVLDTIYFKNAGKKNLTITKVQVDGVVCNSSSTSVAPNTLVSFDFSSCVTDNVNLKREVVVFTDESIFSKFMLIQGLTNIGTNLSASFSGTSCGVGYSRIYGLDALSDAHAEAPSETDFTYNLCVTHDTYTIGNVCSGTYERLFYLGNTSSSHIWLDNSSAYPEPWVGYYNWTPVCVSSSGGTTDLTYSSSDLSNSGYVCLGSYLQNDSIGGHIGDCSAYSNKIWFSLS